MTAEQFEKKFHWTKDRAYAWSSETHAPAPWPKFDPAAINIRDIEEECHPKDYSVSFDRYPIIDIDWRTQEDCTRHEKFDEEIIRCMKHIGFVGTVHIELYDRDGYDHFEYDLTID